MQGEAICLNETARIDEYVQSLAGGKLSLRMLLFYAFFAASEGCFLTQLT
jgi:hypothetical protein